MSTHHLQTVRPLIVRGEPQPMTLDVFPEFVTQNYEIHQWRHACAILAKDFPSELADLADVLTRFRLRKSWI